MKTRPGNGRSSDISSFIYQEFEDSNGSIDHDLEIVPTRGVPAVFNVKLVMRHGNELCAHGKGRLWRQPPTGVARCRGTQTILRCRLSASKRKTKGLQRPKHG